MIQACRLCRSEAAVFLCQCETPQVPLCAFCLAPHQSTQFHAAHSFSPISNLEQAFHQCLQQTEAFTLAKAKLRSNVELLDRFTEEFKAAANSTFNTLAKYRDSWLQWAATEKTRVSGVIEAAIQEAEGCFCQGVEPTSSLAKALTTLLPEQLVFIHYSVTVPEMKWDHDYSCNLNRVDELLSSVRQRPASAQRCQTSDANPRKFAVVSDGYVELYDLTTYKTSRHSIAANFGNGGSYLRLDAEALLCVGGRVKTREVFSMNLISLQLTAMPELRLPRYAAGVAKLGSCVFVFGGDNLKSCEKLQLGDTEWHPAGRMHYSRSNFAPCVFQVFIYLVGSAPFVERFNAETENFALLPVSLPSQLQSKHSVAFFVNEELILLTSNKLMGRWKFNSETEFRISSTGKTCYSTQPPLLLNSIAYISTRSKKLKFSLDSFIFI